jgi:hypothetical protein
LLKVLSEPESELSSLAARALGRLGDKRAIGPLRRALHSGYPFLEANSVRALAMLGDVESVPYFLERLRAEPSNMLRTAYASALGKLGAVEAVDDLFSLLCQADSEVMRGEVGLALARLAGDERYYLQHWQTLRSNPHTAAGQAVLALQKAAKALKWDAFVELSETCAGCFARGDVGEGVVHLNNLIRQLPAGDLNGALVSILNGCADGLSEFGATRLEFILLALHGLDIALRQPGTHYTIGRAGTPEFDLADVST